MEVMVQSPTSENFDFMSSGSMTSPYLSAPSSPKRFGEFYLSAPASPSRLSQLYTEFDYFSPVSDSVLLPTNDNSDDGFAFSVNRESENPSRSAEELFHGGKIKPLKPEKDEKEQFVSKKEPYSVSETEQNRGRGRDRATQISVLSNSNSGRRVTRSHSPYRKSNPTWELEEEHVEQPRRNKLREDNNSGVGSKSSRIWRLRDLLLFRSASEGRASSKDPLKKYYKKGEEIKGSSSFRSSDSSKRKGNVVGAHELHYAMKKAESQDLKKRTFLPYRQGILGRLAGLGF